MEPIGGGRNLYWSSLESSSSNGLPGLMGDSWPSKECLRGAGGVGIIEFCNR